MSPTFTGEAEQHRQAFPDSFKLELLCPDSSDFNIETYLKQDPRPQIKPRDILLFEELLPVYIVVHSSLDEASFTQILQNVEVDVTAHASAAAPPPRLHHDAPDTGPEKPLKAILDNAVLLPRQASLSFHAAGEGTTSYAGWRTELLLRYPAQQLHRPAVHFSASATLKPSDKISHIDATSEYLPSAVPMSENLLQSLEHSPSFAHTQLCLPASRLLKVAPRSSTSNGDIRPLRVSSKLFPIVPVLMVRLHTSSRTPELLASLDLEVARYVDCDMEIQAISVSDSDLVAEPLDADLQAQGSTMSLCTGDRSVLLYKLFPREHNGAISYGTTLKALTFNIKARARLSESCTPRLHAQWHGEIGMQQGREAGKSHHVHRPSSIMSPPSQSAAMLRPSSKHVSITGRPGSTLRTDLGVSFAFSGPTTVIRGETFHLDVFAVNRSSKRKTLAVIAVPLSAKSSLRQHSKLRLSTGPAEFRKNDAQIAEPVLDDRSTYGMQNLRKGQIAEIVCLNADVRIGPLPPGACHNVQLEFLTLSTGVVGLAALNIVDLESKEITQITELPDVLVLDAT